jgi:hypothetical protein
MVWECSEECVWAKELKGQWVVQWSGMDCVEGVDVWRKELSM